MFLTLLAIECIPRHDKFIIFGSLVCGFVNILVLCFTVSVNMKLWYVA